MTPTTQGQEEKNIRIIVGLGNPDPDLLNTYHNVGILALPVLAAHFASESSNETLRYKRYKDSFEYATAGKIVLVKSLVYMNNSGIAVKEAARVLKAKPEEIAIIHDDSDLPIGTFKIVRSGGAAGHNGIRSIIAHLGTEDFTRIRIGIRNPDEVKRKKAGDFVLSPIDASTMKKLKTVFEAIGEKIRE